MSDLIAAYEATEYHVHAELPFVLKVGEYSHELEALMSKEHVECAIYITAYNPFSISQNDDVNEAANKMLRKQLGSKVLSGFGQDASGKWPGEKSYLSLGYEYPDIGYQLARQFGQNAFLWIDERCTPMLLISNKELMTDRDIQIEYNLTLGAQWRSRHIPRPAPAGSGLDFESFLKKFKSSGMK